MLLLQARARGRVMLRLGVGGCGEDGMTRARNWWWLASLGRVDSLA